ncbi:nucleoside diphosphate kinase 6 [Caerostris extrusa]|uniref:Nucleoside diphosphate kinase n=1 Tax=Caerostris extrusa TaxID=172846 RepID=A0AAV4W3Z3_CAEEX|nr:nucleoside diphosphate kinase 6 [Caerostris extrusa]
MSKFLAPLELTLAIIKPDICRNPYSLQLIREIMLERNFYFVGTKITQLNKFSLIDLLHLCQVALWAQYEAPDSIRAKFGLTDTRNATHGSDSPDTARREIAFFFPEFSMEDFYKYHEEAFRNNETIFDPERWVHRIRDAKAQKI